MARLIDANTVVTIQVYDDMTEEYSTKKMTIASAIDEWSDEGCPPTVEAIPIEWIKKWVGKNASDPINVTWNTYTLRMLEGMLDDWEKENEH